MTHFSDWLYKIWMQSVNICIHIASHIYVVITYVIYVWQSNLCMSVKRECVRVCVCVYVCACVICLLEPIVNCNAGSSRYTDPRASIGVCWIHEVVTGRTQNQGNKLGQMHLLSKRIRKIYHPFSPSSKVLALHLQLLKLSKLWDANFTFNYLKQIHLQSHCFENLLEQGT